MKVSGKTDASTRLTQTQVSAEKSLLILRMVWAGMLLGVIVMFLVVAGPALLKDGNTSEKMNVSASQVLLGVNSVMLLIFVAIGYFARMQLYKRHWHDNVVQPEGYFSGNLMLFALCEGMALLSIVNAMMAQEWYPYLLPGLAAVLVILINFPTGKPLKPHAPDLAEYSPYHQGDD